ncbi:rod shape-determining protein MreC [Desmospora profundinema]|uniref:Cell shape-determining protein MreC n=1 Tax=Desmospora profundinema TaxID=1571184 RepID=A0ABU1INT1_9BACL|nr:rod shape-determining protein MreC [Desmospora profundinema]MDR6226423.1 rod shape-determining protein MreC [Desmospora profundinema]
MFFRLFANRRLFIFLLSVILLTVTAGMTRGEREHLSWPEAAVKTTVAWVQGLLAKPTHAMTGWWDHASDARKNGQNDLQLQSELERLRQENKQLKEAVGYIDKTEADLITAQVVSRSPDRWNNRMVIDRGTADGVEKDMPVITHEGLIGRVQAATKHMADVVLLTDSGSGPGIAAHIQAGDEEVFGLIEGYDTKTKRLLMKKISSKQKLKEGQLVVTSNMSDIYSGGLLVGTVDEVSQGDFGVDQMVSIKTAARFERLDYVMVVRDPQNIQLQEHQETVQDLEKEDDLPGQQTGGLRPKDRTEGNE